MKAMLLAAGRGERMGALTDACPKPLLSVAGKPLLQHHLERLQQAGFQQVVINASYLADQIAAFVDQYREQNPAPGMQIDISAEFQRLETGGGIHNALSLLGSDPFVVVNSDVWTDFPLSQLSLDIQGQAHLVLVNNPDHNPEGDFALASDGRVQAQGSVRFTFSGVSVLSPELFENCRPGPFPLAPLLRQAMSQGGVTGQHHAGIWMDVGTPQRLSALETLILKTH